MAVLKLRKYGDPILRRKAEEIRVIDEEVRKLASNMLETLKSIGGIGLAGNQVGEAKRIFVIDRTHIDGEEMPIVLINPDLVESSDEQVFEEGCLSAPGIYEDVTRARKVKVRGLNLKGKTMEIEGEGLLCRALLHEIDHLNGILFIDHLSTIKRKLLGKRLRKISENQ
ncbi:MAG: peptide deformylase [candidate division Zixibacteria bacterium]|nr:peptide deformylase [candidate division Zixibacteria bacterium]